VAFEGDLKNLPLADVLQTINQNNLTGTLTVRDAKGDRRIAFSQGFITAFQPAPGEGRPVIDALAKRRIVARSEAEKARGGFLGKRKTLRMALASRGLVTEEDYIKVVKEDVLEGIYELFLETDRTFKFEDGQTDLTTWDQDQIAAEVRLPAAPIVMEGARRCDEWSRIRRSIGSFNEVLVRDGGGEEGDDDTTRELLQLADGSRDLGTVLDQLPVPRFKGCEAAAGLIASRRLRPASVNEYVTLGGQAEERGAFDEAARLYERGLTTERGNLGLRQRRANALERAGRKAEAADERKLLAGAFMEQGKKQEAAAELTRAADLAPRDPVPLEKKLQLAHEAQDKESARVMAARLAALFEDLGLQDKARDTLRAHLARWPDDDEVREKLAELLHRQGDPRGALNEWVELGNRALRAEALALAAARFRKAVELDPGDQTVRTLLRDIETGEITARRIRRMKRIWFSIGSAVLITLIATLAREAWAGHELARFNSQVGYPKIAVGSLDDNYDALYVLLLTRDDYPYTFAAYEADELSITLVEIYADTWDQVRAGTVLPPEGRGKAIATDLVKNRLETILGVDKSSEHSLEGTVRAAEALLQQGERTRAEALFRTVVGTVEGARVMLERAQGATRRADWFQGYVDRLDKAHLRARIGQVRTLPLADKVRRRLEEKVGAHMPSVD
jgi:tetratricopeptide (TPR) repeat protein